MKHSPGATVTRIPQSEAQFTDAVIELAQRLGYLVHHCRPARTERGWATPIQGDAGFFDLVLCGHGRLILAELKSDTGTIGRAQENWAKSAQESSPGNVYLWRPRDWDQIEAVLMECRR